MSNFKSYTPRAKYDAGRLMQILSAPVVSEKATAVGDAARTVVFRVLQDATKFEVRAAVELLFKVKVESVSVLNVKGKQKRFRKSSGRRNHVRKAYVIVQEGYELNFSGEAA